MIDGLSETYTVYAYFSTSPTSTDGQTFILSVDGDTDLTVGGSGTQMGTTTAVNNSTGSTMDVVHTKLIFSTQPPSSATTSTDFSGTVAVSATDVNNNVDTAFSENITISAVITSTHTAPNGTLTSTDTGGTTKSPTNGVATWTDTKYNVAETIDIKAVSATTYTTGIFSTAVAVTSDSDGDLTASVTITEPIAISSIADTVGERVAVFDFSIADGGTADALALAVSQIVLNTSGTGTFADITWQLDGPDASFVTGTVGAGTITFSGLSISVADGGSETYTVYAYFSTSPTSTDGQTFILSVDGDTDLTVGGSGTQMGTTSAVNNSTGSTMDVVHSQLIFSTQPPSSAPINTDFSGTIAVSATDVNNNVDTAFSENITISAVITVTHTAAAGTLSSTDTGGTTKSPTNGVATWTDTKYDVAETIDIKAVSATTYTTGIFSTAVNVSLGGPIAHWTFDEGSGQTAGDSVGTNDGTLGSTSGAESSDPTWVCVSGGNALDFDGTDDYVFVSDSASLNFGTGDFTVALWVNSNQAQVVNEWPKLVEKFTSSPSTQGYRLMSYQSTDSPNAAFSIASGGTGATVESTVNIRDGLWHHVGGVKTSTELRIYIDGSLSGTPASHSLGTTSNSADLVFGRTLTSTDFVEGNMDDVRLYERALSADEISTLAATEPTGCLHQLHYRWRNDDGGETGTGATATLENVAEASDNGSNTSKTLTFGWTATAGRLLVLSASWDKEITGLIDWPTGEWTQIDVLQSGNSTQGVTAAMYYKIAIGNETSVELSWNESEDISIRVGEYSGIVTTNPLDRSSSAFSTGAVLSQSTGTTAATTQNDELAIALMGSDSGSDTNTGRSWSNGFTELTYLAGVAGDPVLSVARKDLTSTGTVETTFSVTTGGDEMVAIVATFKVSGLSGGATFPLAEDTPLSGLTKHTTKRLRIEVSNEGTATSGSVLYRLEVSQANPTTCDDSGNTWTRVDTSTHWNMVDSTHFADADATSDILDQDTNPGLTNANTTFVAGELKEYNDGTDDDQTLGIILTTTQFTEIEYAVAATNSATGGATYCFRLTDAGSATDFKYTETKYGKVTLGADLLFGYRKSITLDHTKFTHTSCGATVTNFPVLVSLTDTDLKHVDEATPGRVADLEGDDIIFRAHDAATCSPDSAPCGLDHEIEKYDPSTGELIAWVRIPVLNSRTASSDTQIFMYYGNSDVASSTQDAAGVWDVNYMGVWHLDEDATGTGTTDLYQDSAGTNHGDDQISATGQGGQVGAGQAFDGNDDYVDIGAACLVSSSWTVDLWLNPSTPPDYDRLFIQGTGACATRQIMLYWHTDWLEFYTDTTGAAGNPQGATTALTNAIWSHVAWTYNGSTHAVYVNGQSSSGTSAGFTVGAEGNFYLGRRDSVSTNYWTGGLDEVRLSDTDRGACWIEGQFKTQNEPGDIGTTTKFYDVGAEDPSPLTFADVTTFTAEVASEGGVRLQWRTSYEVANLGFHLYREQGGQRVRVTPEMVAGSALFAGAGTRLTSGHSYGWWDRQGRASDQYWLEDVDLDGTRSWNGPVSPSAGSQQQGSSVGGVQLLQSMMLSQLPRGEPLKTVLLTSGPQQPQAATALGLAELPQQWALASSLAVKLEIRERGWYRVQQPELVAAGLDAGVNPKYLQLYVQGKEQALVVRGESDESFDPGDAI